MGKALDITLGVIVGGIAWIFLELIFSFIPIIGWIVAAIIAGYIAGRLGGEITALILAVISPLLTIVIIFSLMLYLSSLVPFLSIVFSIISSSVLIIEMIVAVINLTFVGIGGVIGARTYKRKTGNKYKKVKQINVQTAQNINPTRNVNTTNYVQNQPKSPVNIEISDLDRIIIEKQKYGLTPEEISNEIGVITLVIQNRLINLIDKGIIPRIGLNAFDILIMQSAKKGIDVNQIADETGTSVDTVNFEIKNLKLMVCWIQI
ncbi:MAG: hypothetical protein ACP5TX_06140 [Thermoplasmata archaeon]